MPPKGQLARVGRLEDLYAYLVGKLYAVYKRESSDPQKDRSGPAVQGREAHKFGAHAKMIFSGLEFFDVLSGTDAQLRKAFQEMVQAARDGKFQVLVVLNASRFARSDGDAWAYINELVDLGVSVYFIEHKVLCGKGERGQVGWHDQIKQPIADAAAMVRMLQHNVEQAVLEKWLHHLPSGRAGWGLRSAPASELPYYKPTEDAARDVSGLKGWLWDERPSASAHISGEYSPKQSRRRVLEMFCDEGYRNLDALGRRLTEEGWRHHGRPFNGELVKHLLLNRINIGEVVFHKGRPDEQRLPLLEPLVPYSWQEEVEAMFGPRRRGTRERRRDDDDHPFIFKNIVTCGSCGSSFYGHHTNGYFCLRHDKYKPCEVGGFVERHLEREMAEFLLRMELPPEADLWIKAYLARRAPAQQDWVTTRRELLDLRARAEDRHMRDLAFTKEQLTARLAELDAELAKLPQNGAIPEPTAQELEKITKAKYAWLDPDFPRAKRRALVEAIFENLVVQRGGKGQDVKIDWAKSKIRPLYEPVVLACLVADNTSPESTRCAIRMVMFGYELMEQVVAEIRRQTRQLVAA